jgi:hypothetical protein
MPGRGLCDGLITRPEESYPLWCVVVCDLETTWMRWPWPTGGLSRQKQKLKIHVQCKMQNLIYLNKLQCSEKSTHLITQFAFLNVSGILGVPSSRSFYANARNAFELVHCINHRRTSKFLRRTVKTLTIWASGRPLTYGRILWSHLFGTNGAQKFSLYYIEHFNILQLM